MRFSRNPSSGALEAYDDNGTFVGVMSTIADFSEKETANDGGPGSGNFNHEGRPGLVGGSGSSGGSEKVRPVKSGEEFADLQLKKFNDAPPTTDFFAAKRGRDNYVINIFGSAGPNRRKPEEDKELFDKYIEIVRTNGDPGKTNKKPIYTADKFDGSANGEDLINGCGFDEEKAQKIKKTLTQYTGDGWRDANQEDLEEFVEKCPVVFQGRLMRGIHVKKEALDKILKEAETGVLKFGKIASWSNDYDTAQAFSTRDDNNKVVPKDEIPVMFRIPDGHSRTAVPIFGFAHYGEKESITGAKASWSVIAIKKTQFYEGVGGGHRDGYEIILMERGEEYD